jgi:hypothetical protein
LTSFSLIIQRTIFRFGGSKWLIGRYDTKESAKKAYALAYEELRDKDVPDDKNDVKAIVCRAKQVVDYGMCDNAAAFANSKLTPFIMDALPDSRKKNQIKTLYVSDGCPFKGTALACSSLSDMFSGLKEEILSEDSNLAKETSSRRR